MKRGRGQPERAKGWDEKAAKIQHDKSHCWTHHTGVDDVYAATKSICEPVCVYDSENPEPSVVVPARAQAISAAAATAAANIARGAKISPTRPRFRKTVAVGLHISGSHVVRACVGGQERWLSWVGSSAGAGASEDGRRHPPSHAPALFTCLGTPPFLSDTATHCARQVSTYTIMFSRLVVVVLAAACATASAGPPLARWVSRRAIPHCVPS
jgi:hypothetical protein